MKKRLSDRADFKNALILAADFASNPGMNGQCELGVRWLKTKTEIWQWNDVYGSEVFTTLPKDATTREIIEATLHDERYPSSVSLNWISVIGDRPPLGGLLCLLWADEESHRTALALLVKLSDSALNRIASRHKNGLRSEKLLDTFLSTWAYLDENGVDIDNISPDIELSDLSPNGILKAFKAECVKIERRAKEARLAREVTLSPYATDIQRIYFLWIADRPQPTAWTGRYPPPGPPDLRGYLEQYVLREDKLPNGVHTIPGSRGYMGRQGPSATIDFDELRKRTSIAE